MQIYSIGHSNRSFDSFVDLLETHGIEAVVDVRTLRGSNYCPHFNQEYLQKHLSPIMYTFITELGGRRRKKKESRNDGWLNVSFQGYADYMETEQFTGALRKLARVAKSKRTTFMCSEAVWWKCHRRMISDALVARGVTVLHIIDKSEPKKHEITDFARVEGKILVYPSMHP